MVLLCSYGVLFDLYCVSIPSCLQHDFVCPLWLFSTTATTLQDVTHDVAHDVAHEYLRSSRELY